MSWIPSHKLYASNGSTLVYTFEYVLSLPDHPTDNPSSIQITSLRSDGAIIIPGGNKSYEFRLNGFLRGADYQDLLSKMLTLESTIVSNTAYVLKIDKTPTTTDNINVKRLVGIGFTGPDKKTTFQYYTITFLANAW